MDLGVYIELAVGNYFDRCMERFSRIFKLEVEGRRDRYSAAIDVQKLRLLFVGSRTVSTRGKLSFNDAELELSSVEFAFLKLFTVDEISISGMLDIPLYEVRLYKRVELNSRYPHYCIMFATARTHELLPFTEVNRIVEAHSILNSTSAPSSSSPSATACISLASGRATINFPNNPPIEVNFGSPDGALLLVRLTGVETREGETISEKKVYAAPLRVAPALTTIAATKVVEVERVTTDAGNGELFKACASSSSLA